MSPNPLPDGGIILTDPDELWDAWQPADLPGLLAGVRAPWYVAAGWALDLFRGEQTREHGDLEIGIPADAYSEVRQALASYRFEAVGDGRVWPEESPAFGQTHQTWVSEPAPELPGGRVFRLDVFREPTAGGDWVCRRDERIRLPLSQVVRHDKAGLPYLAPELVLLFKAKHRRPKDEADFAGVLPFLTDDARVRLRTMLELVHPGHAWIEAL